MFFISFSNKQRKTVQTNGIYLWFFFTFWIVLNFLLSPELCDYFKKRIRQQNWLQLGNYVIQHRRHMHNCRRIYKHDAEVWRIRFGRQCLFDIHQPKFHEDNTIVDRRLGFRSFPDHMAADSSIFCMAPNKRPHFCYDLLQSCHPSHCAHFVDIAIEVGGNQFVCMDIDRMDDPKNDINLLLSVDDIQKWTSAII